MPNGERSCDLWALARSPLLVDQPPSYLKLPRHMRYQPPTPEQAQALCTLAREAIAARAAGRRRYLAIFEAEVARRFPPPSVMGSLARAARAGLRVLTGGVS